MLSDKTLAILFVAGAALTWGVYVPTVHMATRMLGSNLRAFLFVGVAYFLVAVLVPALLIFVLKFDPTQNTNAARGALPNFNTLPVVWGIVAGIWGAVGALCVIFAAKYAGGPLWVAPLVFAGAPIVNTIVTITYFAPAKQLPSPMFFVGLLMAILGAALVMIYKPESPKHAHGAPAAAPAVAQVSHH